MPLYSVFLNVFCTSFDVINLPLEYESRLFEGTIRKNVIGKLFYMIADMEISRILQENFCGAWCYTLESWIIAAQCDIYVLKNRIHYFFNPVQRLYYSNPPLIIIAMSNHPSPTHYYSNPSYYSGIETRCLHWSFQKFFYVQCSDLGSQNKIIHSV